MRGLLRTAALAAVAVSGVLAAPAPGQEAVKKTESQEYTHRQKESGARDAGSTTKYFRESPVTFEM